MNLLNIALFESRRTRFRKFKIREKFEISILGFLSARPNTRTFPRHKRRQDLIAYLYCVHSIQVRPRVSKGSLLSGFFLRFRDTILASGGSRHPRDVFEDFRKRPLSTDALLATYGLE